MSMKTAMNTVSDIRSEFLGFFADKGHEIVPSAPLVPQNDPTLMFTNAGMVQFKNVFTGAESRDYTRATSSQKCVRAGGKHNDLENVGYTARHHTFFEMLGNFSFGDYFKEEAISYAWELVSKNFALDQDKLLVTVYAEDEEAASLWRKIAGFSDSKIIRIPTSDNFWSMGDTGPCGPCSEIFYDQGPALQGGPPGSPNEDGDRYLEFWNLVFMQYEQFEGGVREALPKPSIDTGMGLERMAAIMQGKLSNYDVDLMRDIIEQCADLTGVNPDGDQAASHRVIADHLRAASFLMADGVMPSNEGRGYVLRRIMRRGMRHAHLLGANEPVMYKLFPTLQSKMGAAYPELKRAEALITETLRGEEERFKATLDKGLKLLEDEAGKIKNNVLPGDVAFKLYDTFGFPLDLTQDALKAQGAQVDVEGFNTCMEEQRAKARAAWSGSGDAGTEKLWFQLLDEVGSTEFLGYESESAEGEVRAIVKDGALVDSLSAGEDGIVITNQTPFYGESGGQVGDKGTLTYGDKVALEVTDTRKQLGQLHLHYVSCNKGELKTFDAVEMKVDHENRRAICTNHSATHLLHEALREVLGEHVSQKGSLQDAQRTRFDISHSKGVTSDEIARVEHIVNEQIRGNTPVETRLMPLEDARESGAMALFGEKYDDEVRVVTMGRVADGANKPFSVELCGGTHVSRTGDIGLLKIVSEGALSSGVRRIEALTGNNALAYLNQQDAILNAARSVVNASGDQFLERLEALAKDKKALEKQVSDLRKQLAMGGGSGDAGGGAESKDIGGVNFIGKILDGFPPKDLKSMVDKLRKQQGSGVVVLVATNDGKASIIVGVSEDLTDKLNAVELVKIGAAALGGSGGGGRPDMAQAGGPDAAAANDAVGAIEKGLAG